MSTISRNFIEEDIKLQRFAATPQEQKPRYDWSDIAEPPSEQINISELFIEVEGERRGFDIGEIAETIGNAVTDLALARDEEEIFSEKNRQLVAGISDMVARELFAQLKANEGTGTDVLTLSHYDISEMIERALVRNNVATAKSSLGIPTKLKSPSAAPSSPKAWTPALPLTSPAQ